MINKLALIFLLFPLLLNGQTIELTGKIKDFETGKSLPYANVRLLGTNAGTSANINGQFSIRLPQGNYTLITSYIGYASDTTAVNLNKRKTILISLKPINLQLPEVTVLPGKNPAIPIIKAAIKRKKEREKNLNSYIYKSYTKAIIKTQNDVTAGNSSVTISIGNKDDSSKLFITGIIENESQGYYKKPDLFKEVILARKQTANAPPTINILTGGRLQQNFYEDDVEFFGRRIPGPLDDNSLDYYYYYLSDSLAYDNYKVYKIYFSVIDDTDPGYFGNLYIDNKNFNLVKISVHLNRAANPAGIFSDVKISQQFLPYAGNIFMPIDYRLAAEGNLFGVAKFGFEINSIFHDYEINPDIKDDFFDLAILSVLPDADEKDSLYWKSSQTIPSTLEEITAYRKIDSLKNIPKTFWDNFSLISFAIPVGKNFSVSGPLSLYRFNRVQGHTLQFNLAWHDLFKKRMSGNTDIYYGFSDKQLKWKINSEYLFGPYRTGKIKLKLFDQLSSLFEETDYYNHFTSTFYNLFYKDDFRNYFYQKGFSISVSHEIFPIFDVGIAYSSKTDKSAFVNTNFSFFYKDDSFPPNMPIYEGSGSLITFTGTLDFRDYIEDGYYRRRISGGKSFLLLNGDISFGNFKAKKTFQFTKYHANATAALNTFGTSRLQINANVYWASGVMPFQYLTALPGNVNALGKNNSFRTLDVGEVYADRVASLFLHYDFSDELFRRSGISLLKRTQLMLAVYLGVAITSTSESVKRELSNLNFTEFKRPFYELGFSIGHPMFPFNFEFTWKLNYNGKDDFVFGVNSLVF